MVQQGGVIIEVDKDKNSIPFPSIILIGTVIILENAGGSAGFIFKTEKLYIFCIVPEKIYRVKGIFFIGVEQVSYLIQSL